MKQIKTSNPPSINWEAFEAKRGRAFTQEEKCFLEVVSLGTEALRLTVQVRERFLLGCLHGEKPKLLRKLRKLALDGVVEASGVLAFETSVYHGEYL